MVHRINNKTDYHSGLVFDTRVAFQCVHTAPSTPHTRSGAHIRARSHCKCFVFGYSVIKKIENQTKQIQNMPSSYRILKHVLCYA